MVVLRLYLCLVGDVFEGFFHHSIELAFRPERYDEAVVNSEDRRVPPDKLLDDIFACAGVEVHIDLWSIGAILKQDLKLSAPKLR